VRVVVDCFLAWYEGGMPLCNRAIYHSPRNPWDKCVNHPLFTFQNIVLYAIVMCMCDRCIERSDMGGIVASIEGWDMIDCEV